MPLKLTSSRQSISVTRVAFWLPEESNVQRNKERMGLRAAISNSKQPSRNTDETQQASALLTKAELAQEKAYREDARLQDPGVSVG